MPSREHEALAQLFRNRPELVAELLRDALGIPVPPYEKARVESEDVTEWNPAEYRADVVISLEAGRPALAVIVEVQRGKDPDKRWSWPVYLAGLRARLRCPAILLVICVDAAVARWCATPIDTGHPGWTLTPLVLGPETMPLVTDERQAAQAPELAVLSALTHATGPHRHEVLRAAFKGVQTIGDDWGELYADIVFALLPESVKEEVMRSGTYEYVSDFARKCVAEGEVKGEIKGEIKAIFAVLKARGLTISEEAHQRITACTDPVQLQCWITRAATADTLDEIFD